MPLAAEGDLEGIAIALGREEVCLSRVQTGRLRRGAGPVLVQLSERTGGGSSLQ